MKASTKEKLQAINRDVPSLLKQKAVEKLRLAKDPFAIYIAVVELLLVFGIALAFFIFIDPGINIIPAEKMPNEQKIAFFLLFSAIAILLFFYNKKFFSQAARGTKWVWKWKAKK